MSSKVIKLKTIKSRPKLTSLSLAGTLLSLFRKRDKFKKINLLLKVAGSLGGRVLVEGKFRPKPIVYLNRKTSLSQKRIVGVNHHSR
ncbi:MAG TPA: hypothetical protein V6D12_00265 [Candidatus Obscuribacterales bacterium]